MPGSKPVKANIQHSDQKSIQFAQQEYEAKNRAEQEEKERQAEEDAYYKDLAKQPKVEENDSTTVLIPFTNLMWDRDRGYFNKTARLSFKAEIPLGDFKTYQPMVKLFGKFPNGITEQISNHLLTVDMERHASKEIYLFYPKGNANSKLPTEGDYFFTVQLGYEKEVTSPNIKVLTGVCTDKVPPAPVEKMGTCPYYPWRHQNFISRHVGCQLTPPDYYLSYGYKYCIKFSKETAPILSVKGKVWLGKARRNLQNEIENRLNKKPEIERDSTMFTDFAFNTHVAAYWKSGLANLNIFDLIRIGFTPDFKEWKYNRTKHPC